MTDMTTQIRQVLAEFGRLSVDAQTIPADADLYRLGLTSHASVNLMLGLEDAFDIEFPEHLLRKSTFASITAIEAAINDVLSVSGAAAGCGA